MHKMMDFTAGLPHKPEGKKGFRLKFKKPSLPMALAGIAAVVLVGASIGMALYFFNKYEDAKSIADKAAIAEETKDTIIEEVAKIYAVPKEEPTLARVNDPGQLSKEQDFFAKAEQGDYVIVYPEAQLAILYRDREKKIINVGPVSVAPNSTTPQGTEQQSSQ
jgi:hypothetical protein